MREPMLASVGSTAAETRNKPVFQCERHRHGFDSIKAWTGGPPSVVLRRRLSSWQDVGFGDSHTSHSPAAVTNWGDAERVGGVFRRTLNTRLRKISTPYITSRDRSR
jgi:hypothetical protein